MVLEQTKAEKDFSDWLQSIEFIDEDPFSAVELSL